MLHKIGQRLTSLFGEPHIGTHGISNQELKENKEIFAGYPFANVLPYEVYDEENALFIGKSSLGFTIEAIPLDGCEEALQREISSIFEEILEEGDSIQCLLWADHRIDSFLQKWQKAREGTDEIFQEIAQKRAEFFKTSSKFSARTFRFILSYSIPKTEINEKVITSLKQKREKILKILSCFTYAFSWTAKHFIDTVGAFINFELKPEVKTKHWNPYETLSNQLTSGGVLKCNEEGLEWKNGTAFKSYRVVDSPDSWTLGAMQLLIGDVFRSSYKINFPFYLHYGVHCPKQSKAENNHWKKEQLIEKQGRSHALLRMIPRLEPQLKECAVVRNLSSQGARFVWAGLSAGVWAHKNSIQQAEQSLKSLFRLNYFTLVESCSIHLPCFLACLPMTWAEYAIDLKYLNVLKTTLTIECANFVPLQGEWTGTNKTSGMLLLGRRGQITNWNPFDNESGNYNIAIAGRSGSGKSVFMQELLLNGLGIGYRSFVIDVGRSFAKMCDLVGGQSIHFSSSSNICLNPFSHIPQEDVEKRENAFSLLKSTIACMAAPMEGTTDYQNGLIEKAIRYAWNLKKNHTTITDVANWLTSHEDIIGRTLGVMLTPYTKEGIYAKYFEGENNIDFNNPMVVIELEELKDKKDLQEVVLQLSIMTITNKIFLGDRKTPFYICLDEAWSLLRAKQSVSFIETLARRLRKYNGSLVVGTQGIEDFFANPAAQAAFENSDWVCLCAQKATSIKSLAKTEKIDLTEHKQRLLESVKKVDGEYSEAMIIDANGHYAVTRLVLDPFSQLLYSTSPKVCARLTDLKEVGLSTTEAINHMLEENSNQTQKSLTNW